MIEIDAILFDMDGVLIDSMPAHAAAWMRVFAEAGIDVDEDEIYRREGEQGAVTVRALLKRSGIMSTKKRVRTLLERKEEAFARTATIRPFPGAVEAVRAVGDAGLAVGLVSGTSRDELENVLPEELKAPMRVIVTGDEVLHGKPNPEPYLKAIMALGVRPEKTLVIENAPYGISSAVKAGALCLAIRSYLPDADLAEAHYRIDTLKELVPFLKENVKGFG